MNRGLEGFDLKNGTRNRLLVLTALQSRFPGKWTENKDKKENWI